MSPCLGVRGFVLEARTRLSDPHAVFVIGNESADCDSVVSAIAYAYLSGDSHIPVVNNSRKVLELRGEVLLALSKAGLGPQDLVYLDDILEYQPLRLVLVDHNEPSAKWTRLALKYEVQSILDHHEDGRLFVQASPRIVRTCASTTSILIDMFACTRTISAELAEMLKVALCFDTTNWTWRVTEYDVASANLLLHAALTREALHEFFASVMQDIEDHAVSEEGVEPLVLLQKDYKMYSKALTFYGISVIHTDFKSIGVDALVGAMHDLIESDGLQFLVILSAVRYPGQYSFYQQFALYHNDYQEYKRIIGSLEGPLELKVISLGPDKNAGLFAQLDHNTTRKRLQPMIHKLLGL